MHFDAACVAATPGDHMASFNWLLWNQILLFEEPLEWRHLWENIQIWGPFSVGEGAYLQGGRGGAFSEGERYFWEDCLAWGETRFWGCFSGGFLELGRKQAGEGCLVPFQGACNQMKSNVRSLGGHFLLEARDKKIDLTATPLVVNAWIPVTYFDD